MDDLLVLQTSSGDIVTTEDHRFSSVTDQAWHESQDLDEGDQLLSANGVEVVVEGLDWATTHLAPAYDLDIAGIDTFYVAAGEYAVLVHNCDPALARLQADDTIRNNIANGHAASKPAGEFPGQSLRGVIDGTIDGATSWGNRSGTRWWYNEKTMTVVYENPVKNSYGDYGTVFRVTAPNYRLPDRTITNPT